MTELIRLLTRAQKLLRTASDDAMSRHGVRVGQNLVLEVLWETDGLTPGELASRLHVTTPTVVNTATRMESAGLLVRRRDPADGRLVRLYLTPKAQAARQPIEEARRRLAEHATATLTDDERRHMRSALEKIIKRMTESPPDLGDA
ncbi:MarR family winged helix-turn-helix transcriptional regulator [Planotetraspora kaengkrachanensis]|uniref:MarR family transcriptional regulator n=1 Tax=Planotetraspora kaengkrachanensis TaxID=575193 RepID=A0A8J3LYV1_9ACTN|nr:MarR family transcriptional regulator [Planotetraspora kaengkrachanensis]GIG80429.1 MarR family transcriptional regulator [Planotetraspora kaengkrachanensis]